MTIDDVLERAGMDMPRSRKIICPWHADTTASLHLYDNGAYCFACHTSASPEWLLKALTGEYVARQNTENIARKVRDSAKKRLFDLSGRFFVRLDSITQGTTIAFDQKRMWSDEFQLVDSDLSEVEPQEANEMVDQLAHMASYGLKQAHLLAEWEREMTDGDH